MKIKNIERIFFTLAVTAGLLFAVVTAADNFIIKQIITAPEDQFTAVLVYLVLGSWIGIAINFATSNFAGKHIDSNFSKVKLWRIREQKRAIASGMVSGLGTMFAIWGAQIVDPSLVAIMGQVSLVYLVIYDVLGGRITVRNIAVPAAFVFVGATMASMKSTANIAPEFMGLFLLAVCRSGLAAISQVFDQKEMKSGEMDAVNYAFWRFFWLGVSGTVIAISISLFRLQLGYFFELMVDVFLPALPLISGLMVIVTLANALQTQARRFGEASLVALLSTVKLVAIIPITIMGNWVYPDMFGVLPSEEVVWGIRLIGGLLVIYGIEKIRNLISKQKSLPNSNVV